MPRKTSTVTVDRILGFKDLVKAYYDCEYYRAAGGDVSAWYDQRLDLLKRLMGFGVDDTDRHDRAHGPEEWEAERDESAVQQILNHCLTDKVPFPFGRYMEGGPGPREQALRDRHERRLDILKSAYAKEMRRLFVTTLVSLQPTVRRRKVRESKLWALGLPREAPEPDDFYF